MAIITNITVIPPAGHRGVDTQDVFVTKQEAFQDALTGVTVTQLNSFATEANALEVNVNAKEGLATTAAGTATTKAAEAVAARDIAVSAQIAAEAALDNFDDRYLGAKATAPTLDNDGNALIQGATYWNTTNSTMYVWDGSLSQWIADTFVPTSHTSLTGLASDDHLQYHNDTRGDVRYYTKAQVDAKIVLMLTFDSSSTLRTADNGSMAYVQGLGLFSWSVTDSTFLDDGETCFITTSGQWVLKIQDSEYLYGYINSYVTSYVTSAIDVINSKILKATFSMTLTSLAAITSSTFTVTVSGAEIGDAVFASAGNVFGTSTTDAAKLHYEAYVSAADTVIVSIRNASATTAAMTASTWTVIVIKK